MDAEHDPELTLYSIPEVAEILKCSPSYAYRLIQQGEIPAVRIGRMRRVRRASLLEYLMRLEAQPA